MLLILFTKIISIPLKKISKKQNAAKKERDLKIAELKANSNGDQAVLTDRIYQYYKDIDYNPVKLFFSKAIIFILNFAILFGVLGVFQPISNFSDLDKQTVKTVTSIYQENFEPDSYLELDILHNLDNVKPLLKDEISQSDIDNLYKVKEKFMVGDLDTTIIPIKSNETLYVLLPVLVLILTILEQIILNLKKQEKIQLIISLFMAAVSVGITAFFVFKTPIVVCVYFLINNVYTLCFTILNIIKHKRGKKCQSK